MSFVHSKKFIRANRKCALLSESSFLWQKFSISIQNWWHHDRQQKFLSWISASFYAHRKSIIFNAQISSYVCIREFSQAHTQTHTHNDVNHNWNSKPHSPCHSLYNINLEIARMLCCCWILYGCGGKKIAILINIERQPAAKKRALIALLQCGMYRLKNYYSPHPWIDISSRTLMCIHEPQQQQWSSPFDWSAQEEE